MIEVVAALRSEKVLIMKKKIYTIGYTTFDIDNFIKELKEQEYRINKIKNNSVIRVIGGERCSSLYIIKRGNDNAHRWL